MKTSNMLLVFVAVLSLGLFTSLFLLWEARQELFETQKNVNAAAINAAVSREEEKEVQKPEQTQPSAVRTETVNGRLCTVVELYYVEPEHDPVAKTYRFVVDFGTFREDDCVHVNPPEQYFEERNIQVGGGASQARKIVGTTKWEYVYQYQ